MEGRDNLQESKTNLSETSCLAADGKVDDKTNDIKHFGRERNLLLLSALYKLYGEEWTHIPDWTKVASEIQNAKIPFFGESFTPESCELQYNAFFDEGYQMGLPSTSTVFKTPKRLTEAQKRQWILATTSTDLVVTSEIIDGEMRKLFINALDEIETLATLDSDSPPHEFSKQSELSGITEMDVECDEEEEFEHLEAQEAAVELSQIETNALIVGFKDVLLLNQYCVDAVENAVNKYASLIPLTKKPLPVSPETPPMQPEVLDEITNSSLSTNDVPEELMNTVSLEITNVSSEDDTPENSTQTPTVPTTPPKEELPDLTFQIRLDVKSLPEIHAVNQDEVSSNKQSPNELCAGPNEEENNPETAKEASASTEEVSSKGNEEQPSPLPSTSPARVSPILETTGQAMKDSASADTASVEKSPLKIESDQLDKEQQIGETSPNKPNKQNTEVEPPTISDDEIKNVSPSVSCEGVVPTEDALINDVSETPVANELSDTAPQESPTKGKQGGRKCSSAKPITTRTSSRLVSPEPIEQTTKEEEKNIKRTPTRPTVSESHTPVLRSRRGTTPTKSMVTENDTVKTSSVTTSKLDFTEEEEDDTFATPRSSPESPEVLEVAHETKPPKQLKVYSAKLPSPLSHVDRLFSEFIDDEDPELSMIDNNIKSKSDKSVSKAGSKRGRTVSSENASDVGNNDDNGHNKRVNRKIGFNDDSEELENAGNTDEGSKRLTRSSLKLHDAANEEGTDAPQTESEKAASESSFNGKEKKPRTSKSMSRLKNLQEEMTRVYGDGDETSEGRLTRARAKTTVPLPEKRSKPPSVGDSECLSESEPIPSRSTRSRSTTTSSMPVLEPTTAQQLPVVEDEEQKAFRKNAIAFVDKLMASDAATLLQKNLLEDPSKILKKTLDFASIKTKIENGKARTTTAIYHDLITLATNAIMAQPTSPQVKENATLYYKLLRSTIDDFKNLRTSSVLKNDNSDVESLESHDEQRSESSSKQTGGGVKRKRKRSTSETSEEVVLQENKRRVTRTSTSTTYQQGGRKTKHPISPDIVSANRSRH